MKHALPQGRTGLLGGTFNPIHLGHLHIAQETLRALNLERVLFIPNRQPPHRKADADLVDEEHRFAMTQIAVASNPRFFASRIELERDGPSYSVDTVDALLRESPSASLYFITGADALLRYVWKDLDRLLGMLTAMVAVTRPGTMLEDLRMRLDNLNLVHKHAIQTLDIEGFAVSSTDIRTRAARGESLRYLVPREVEDYIDKYGLYRKRGIV